MRGSNRRTDQSYNTTHRKSDEGIDCASPGSRCGSLGGLGRLLLGLCNCVHVPLLVLDDLLLGLIYSRIP